MYQLENFYFVISTVFFFQPSYVHSVQPLLTNIVFEGECLNVDNKLSKSLNKTWLETTQLPYLIAGSKYHLFRMVSNHFRSVPEYMFYYEACLNSKIENGIGIATGFDGGFRGTYKVVKDGSSIYFTPQNQIAKAIPDTVKHQITLTDNKNFVFFTTCWMNSNKRGWDVISTTAELTQEVKREIEEHAKSLGFKEENFVFLNYGLCEKKQKISATGYQHEGEIPENKSIVQIVEFIFFDIYNRLASLLKS